MLFANRLLAAQLSSAWKQRSYPALWETMLRAFLRFCQDGGKFTSRNTGRSDEARLVIVGNCQRLAEDAFRPASCTRVWCGDVRALGHARARRSLRIAIARVSAAVAFDRLFTFPFP